MASYLIRFMGFRATSGKRVRRAKRFAASCSRDALELARQHWDPESYYYPTYLLGANAAKLSQRSVSAEVARNAGPEEI